MVSMGIGIGITKLAIVGGGRSSASMVGSPYTEGVDDSSITLRIARAEVGASYSWEISSSGGGTPVTGSGTVGAAGFDITGIDITALNVGTLTVTYSEDSVLVATGSGVLSSPSAANVRVTQASDRRVTQAGDVRIAA